jgi:hypothetical protein
MTIFQYMFVIGVMVMVVAGAGFQLFGNAVTLNTIEPELIGNWETAELSSRMRVHGKEFEMHGQKWVVFTESTPINHRIIAIKRSVR